MKHQAWVWVGGLPFLVTVTREANGWYRQGWVQHGERHEQWSNCSRRDVLEEACATIQELHCGSEIQEQFR